MKSYKALLLAALVGAVVVVTTGCSADKSGEVQQMPATSGASSPNKSPSNPAAGGAGAPGGNLPPQAQDAISKAAPPSSNSGK